MRRRPFWIAWTIVAGGLGMGCSHASSPTAPSPPAAATPSSPAATTATTGPASACDARLWAPVYAKDRLLFLSPCQSETGTVVYVELEPDGDLTIHLRPDSDRLLNAGNIYLDPQPPAQAGDPPPCGSKGCLQVEVSCQGAISQRDAMGTCAQFAGTILTSAQVPKVGDWITAAGPLVEDTRHHNWRELHGAVIWILAKMPAVPVVGVPSPPQ